MDIDPTIYFIFVVPDGSPYQATPMQGFAYSLCKNSWLIRRISLLPTTIFDLTDEGRETLVARKMSGVYQTRWRGISPKALLSFPFPYFTPFSLIILPEDESSRQYLDWASTGEFRPTIVAKSGGDLSYEDLTQEQLGELFLAVCDRMPAHVNSEQIQAAREALNQWKPLKSRSLGYQVGGHNTITPNLCALSAIGFDDLVHGRFQEIGSDLGPYLDQIVKTTTSILQERESVGRRDMQRIFRRPPDLNLFAPAIYPWFFDLPAPASFEREEAKRFNAARRVLQRQSGYGFEITSNWELLAFGGVEQADAKLSPHQLLWLRAHELFLATDAVSVLTASEFSALVRWPNEINRTLGAVRNFSEHYRSRAPSSRKRVLAFREVQARLASATPRELLPLIRQARDGIRIIADAHLEWLDLDGLPLMIRKDCSRIPVTPGNLFLDTLSAKAPIQLTPKDFDSILVIRAAESADPISSVFETVFDQFEPGWRDSTTISFVQVSNEDELVAAFDAYSGPMVIFDGHGEHKPRGVGQLLLGANSIDVWSLKDKIETMPPIVILSACDTHAADRNHATTANGFLTLGARAVLSSVFPLNAAHAAIFVARLILRVRVFLKEAPNVYGEALTWLEVISGMLRMQLMTDFLLRLLSKTLINEEQYQSIHLIGNSAINGRAPDPFSVLFVRLEELGLSAATLKAELEIAVANSSVISYLQIGRPETILIDVNDRVARQLKEIEQRTVEA